MATCSPATLSVLRAGDLFGGMAGGDISAIVARGRPVAYPQGSFLFMEGEPAATFYVLLEGYLRLTRLAPSGRQVVVAVLGRGEAVALVAAMSEIPYPATAEAQTAVRAIAWAAAQAPDLMNAYPALAVNGMRLAGRRFVGLQGRFEDLATRPVEQRVAGELLRLAQRVSQANGRGVVLNVPLSRADIAEMTGTTHYTVSRICSGWEQEGIIHTANGRIAILLPDALRAIAEL